MGTFIHQEEKNINKTQATENNTVFANKLPVNLSEKKTSKLFTDLTALQQI